MRKLLALVGLLAAFCACAQTYHPDATWQRKSAAEVGMDGARLKEAIDYAVAAEVRNPRDLMLNHYHTFGREPHCNPIGPLKVRGDTDGINV